MENENKNVVLEVNDLHVSFDTYAGEVKAVRGVTFTLHEGEVLAIVGESGCGKSVTAQTVMKLNPMPPARIPQGEVRLGEHDIVAASEKEMQQLRGKDVSMIFQDPMTCLNPTKPVGKQIVEAIKHHRKLSGKDAKAEAIKYLKMVNIPNPEERAKQYPHEFSGGMRQRAMIAMALSCSPKVLIADEPTTALDVTIQAQIMELIRDMNRKMGTAVLLISHDLGVIRQMCSRVYIMYAGRVVESGETQEVLAHPLHPYTKGLIASIPSLEKRGQRLSSIPGTVPALEDRSEHGCPFYNRCQSRRPSCQNETPPMVVHKGHMALCVNAKEELGL